ncbi:rCG50897, partial [Rattus norvegicus]
MSDCISMSVEWLKPA